jgi:hypothetical protein
MWLTAYGRNYYGATANCTLSTHASLFDGVNDYATFSNGGPLLIPSTSSSSQALISMWVKIDKTSAGIGQFFWTQGVSGNNTNDFWRVLYQGNNSSGTALNRLIVEWRANGASNNIQKQFPLHDNSTITGSTSPTNQWLSTNSNINTNPNGYVHITAIFDMPQTGQAMSGGNLDVFWNGQLLTNTAVNQKQGNSSTLITNNEWYLGVNGYNSTSQHEGKIDEMFISQGGPLITFKNDKGLTTNQDVANYLYNNSCPVDIGVDARYDFGWHRFENNWNVGPAGTTSYGSWSPINGAGFSTDHA